MAFNERQRFGIKYVLPTTAFVLTLITAGQYYTTTVKEDDLLKQTGKVVNIVQDRYKHYKYTDDRIRIWLDNNNNPFLFFDNRRDFFARILNNISPGDTITLYHRTNNQSLFGTGDKYKIMQIQKGSTTLYSFEQAKQTFHNTGSFNIWVVLGLWVLYFFMRNKMRK